jgi:uncharacterized protein YpuA (DUF1002 family)
MDPVQGGSEDYSCASIAKTDEDGLHIRIIHNTMTYFHYVLAF